MPKLLTCEKPSAYCDAAAKRPVARRTTTEKIAKRRHVSRVRRQPKVLMRTRRVMKTASTMNAKKYAVIMCARNNSAPKKAIHSGLDVSSKVRIVKCKHQGTSMDAVNSAIAPRMNQSQKT